METFALWITITGPTVLADCTHAHHGTYRSSATISAWSSPRGAGFYARSHTHRRARAHTHTRARTHTQTHIRLCTTTPALSPPPPHVVWTHDIVSRPLQPKLQCSSHLAYARTRCYMLLMCVHARRAGRVQPPSPRVPPRRGPKVPRPRHPLLGA